MRWSRLTALFLFLAFALVVPAQAQGAQSLAVTSPTGFPAGGDPTYSTKIALDSSAGTPQSVTIKLAPGVLAAPSANPSCVKTTQHTSACQIGTGSVTLAGLAPLPVSAYLAPPPNSADVVGIDVVPAVLGTPVTHAGGKLVQTHSGSIQTVLSLSLSSLGPLAQMVTGMTLTVDGTLEGKPFNRMPTNCSPGHSQLTVSYSKKTESVSASPDFTPTGCASLPYAPKVSGTAQSVTSGAGTVVTTVTQAIGEAASAKTALTLPTSNVTPNDASITLQNTSTPVGSVVTASPLLPAPLKGKIYLTGTFTKPYLLFKFPPPAALTLTGQVNLATNTVTIPVVPDVPLTQLKVTFQGGPKGLLVVSCGSHSGNLRGTFTAQSGKTAASAHPLTVTGCRG
jgi:hypothetical protein